MLDTDYKDILFVNNWHLVILLNFELVIGVNCKLNIMLSRLVGLVTGLSKSNLSRGVSHNRERNDDRRGEGSKLFLWLKCSLKSFRKKLIIIKYKYFSSKDIRLRYRKYIKLGYQPKFYRISNRLEICFDLLPEDV